MVSQNGASVMLSKPLTLLYRCTRLAAPYGRRRLAIVLAVIIVNGIFQVIGVASIFPFLALAADPDILRNSRQGILLFSRLPPISNQTLLVSTGIAAIVLLLISNATSLLADVLRARYGHGLGHYIRNSLITTLSTRPYSYFLERNSGILLQKVVFDTMSFINGVFLILLDAITRMVTLVLLLVTIFFIQPEIAAAAILIFGGLYSCVFLILRKRSRQLGIQLRAANQGTILSAQQFLAGIKPILVSDKADYFCNIFRKHSAEQARIYPLLPIFGNTPRYLIEPIAFGGLVVIVLYLSTHGQSLIEILPSLSVMAMAAYRTMPSVQLLYSYSTQLTTLQYVVSDLEVELNKIYFASNEHRKMLNPKKLSELSFKQTIALNHITFQYNGSPEPVLKDIDLSINRNSWTGIIGPSGSGKSTIADLILGLHTPQAGSITIDNKCISAEQWAIWRQLVGYVPQDIFLLDATIAENIAFGIHREKISNQALVEAAAAAQILDFIEHELPHRWETVVGERGSRLSGGQRQRIGLARALYHKPEVLILDEATSALDEETEQRLMDTVASLAPNMTIITIAHKLSTLKKCDRIVNISGGKIQIIGTYDQL